MESERNFFKVTFRSNDRLDGTGFMAIYQFLEITDEYQSPIQDDAVNLDGTVTNISQFTIGIYYITMEYILDLANKNIQSTHVETIVKSPSELPRELTNIFYLY